MREVPALVANPHPADAREVPALAMSPAIADQTPLDDPDSLLRPDKPEPRDDRSDGEEDFS